MVVAIVAILASIATPNYQQWMAQKAVDRATLQLRDHMELARTYAQAHQTKVVVCPVAANQLIPGNQEPPCAGLSNDWPAWVVKTEDGQVLVSSMHLSDGITIDSGGRKEFVFNERGGANGDNGTIGVNGVRSVTRSITVASDGRIQLDAPVDRSGGAATIITDPPSSSSAANTTQPPQ